jgi:hypothetical protein
MGSLNRPDGVPSYQTLKARILALQNDARYGFVFGTRLTLRDGSLKFLGSFSESR